MNAETRRRLASIATRWNAIEKRMKKVEHFRREAILAAVNELRYTGRRVADVLALSLKKSLTRKEEEKITKDLTIAENYLKNADHDLTDAVILYVLLQVSRTMSFHGISKLSKYAPSYDKCVPLLQEAQSLIQDSRGDRTKRDAVYKKLAEVHVPQLMLLRDEIEQRGELFVPNEYVARGLQLVSVVTFVASIASIIGLGLAIFVWWTSPSTDDVKLMIDKATNSIISEFKKAQTPK